LLSHPRAIYAAIPDERLSRDRPPSARIRCQPT
jgi:hypothetical protein